MYIQRYMRHLPAAGEIVIFDRSWYNRAGVERVMEFCSMEQVKRFLELTPGVEKAIVESGIILIKYWLEVSEEEQTRRLEARIERSAQDLETVADGPEVLRPLVRLFPRPRRHVQGDRHAPGRRGMWCAPTTRGARGSMSSRTSCRKFRTKSCRAKSLSCRSARRRTATSSRTILTSSCRSWIGDVRTLRSANAIGSLVVHMPVAIMIVAAIAGSALPRRAKKIGTDFTTARP